MWFDFDMCLPIFSQMSETMGGCVMNNDIDPIPRIHTAVTKKLNASGQFRQTEVEENREGVLFTKNAGHLLL